MIIDHIGIVVPSIAAADQRWREVFGYRPLTDPVLNTRQQVRVAFYGRTGSLPVKLIEPSAPDSPVSLFARRGGGLHHLCFRVASVTSEVARLQAMGCRAVTPPEPGEAFEGASIAFVYVGDGLSIELIDTDRRASLVGPAGAADAGHALA